MKARRKIIVYIATSADGYIARPDGDVEWLNRRPRTVDYGIGEFYATIDTILWGRKTYDWLVNYSKKTGKTKGLLDTRLTNYVFSRKPPKRAVPGVEFVSEPAKAFAQRLRAVSGKHVWMMGGGELIASFLDAGEIDEFDIHVIPVFIGEGYHSWRHGIAMCRCACAHPRGTRTAWFDCVMKPRGSVLTHRGCRCRPAWKHQADTCQGRSPVFRSRSAAKGICFRMRSTAGQRK